MSFTSRNFKISRPIFVMLIIFMLILINSQTAFTTLSDPCYSSFDTYPVESNLIERDFHELTEKLIASIDDIEDEHDLGLFIPYDESYYTRNYEGWKEYKLDGENVTIATESVVARLGSRLKVAAPTGTELEITPSVEGMTPLDEFITYDDWITVQIPDNGTIGRYTLKGEWNGGENIIDLFIVYDHREFSISNDERKAYVYDENSNRDELTYIFTTSGQLQQANLDLYENKIFDKPSIYEFSLEAVGGSNDAQEAAVRLARIVAQRAEAVPTPLMDYQPMERDASNILFGEGTTVYHGEELEYTGLELEDAPILATNDQTLDSLENPKEHDRTKLINAWCDETSIALTALLRSIGIPSRVVSIHPRQEYIQDSELMGHYTVEVWFEDSMYDKSWDESSGNWYVIDADEWNAEWYVAQPKFWSYIGESFSSREVYGKVAELYFRDHPEIEWEIEKYYVFGNILEDKQVPQLIDVTDYYNRNIMHLEYGSVEKYIGRGGGDLYRLDIYETSRLSIESEGGLSPQIYLNEDKFPALSLTYEGFPPMTPNSNITSDQIILSEGQYFIAIYAPEENGRKLEGNYARYKLSLEKKPGETPATSPNNIDYIDVESDYGEIKLEWSPPSDNGSPILYYNIYRDGELIEKVTSTNYFDRGLENHGTYNYRVTAVNAMGESDFHEEIKVTASRQVLRERPMTVIASAILLIIWIASYLILERYRRKN